MSDQVAPPAGWYPDPYNPSRQRWWDGQAWGPHAQQPPQPARLKRTRNGVFGALSVVAGLVAMLAFFAPLPPLAIGAAFIGIGLAVGGAVQSNRNPEVSRASWIVGFVLNGLVLAGIILSLVRFMSG